MATETLQQPQAQSATSASSERLIGGIYTVDVRRSLPGAGGGLAAYAATPRGVGPIAMAVQARADAPPRMAAIESLADASIAALLTPSALGPARGVDGKDAFFVVCPAPPGPPLSAAIGTAGARPWTEQEILHLLLRPAAMALSALASLGVTHRAIRADNLFRSGPGQQVVLGCAWASPPALLQPAIYEPPYVGACPEAGRGDGGIADDVYALGVTMLILALGYVPLAGLDASEVVRRKIDLGSFAALAGQERLPPIIADLVKGMLAEDPEHRPLPALLADPIAARTRRVAARPQRRAQRPLSVGSQEVWHARGLAFALASDADVAAKLLRSGAVDGWLRRGLGEGPLGARVEEAVRQRHLDTPGDDPRADAMMVMRAVVALDPLAPIAWEGLSCWPDGIGALLASMPAAGDTALGGKIARLIASEAVIVWAGSRSERTDLVTLRLDMRQHRATLRLPGWLGGLPRLRFALNPLMACRSPLLGGSSALRLADLLPALEAAARPELHAQLPIDHEIASFVAARDDSRVQTLLVGLGDRGAEATALAALRLFASLQQRHGGGGSPRLAAWLAHHVSGVVRTWRNKKRRERCAELLNVVVNVGKFGEMLALLDDPDARRADEAGVRAAEEAVRGIDAELAAIVADGGLRLDTARRVGAEVASGLGLAALGAIIIALAAG